MCGKFTQMYSWAEVHEFSNLLDGSRPGDGDGGADSSLRAANDGEETITPMRNARVVGLDGAGKRQVVDMRWGWPDRWSAVPMDRPKHMHARAETIDTLKTFRGSFAARRGILIVRTFNVGEDVGKKVVQHVLTPRDKNPLGLAVIWDEVPTREGESVPAFVMATTLPCPLIATVTDRMPAVLPPEQWAAWLGETDAPLEAVKGVLVPYKGELDMTRQPKAPPKPRSQSLRGSAADVLNCLLHGQARNE